MRIWLGIALAACLMLAAPATSAAACVAADTIYTGPHEGDWQAAANWSDGAVPDAADSVCVPAGINVRKFDGVVGDVARLTVEGRLRIIAAGTGVRVVQADVPGTTRPTTVSDVIEIADGARYVIGEGHRMTFLDGGRVLAPAGGLFRNLGLMEATVGFPFIQGTFDNDGTVRVSNDAHIRVSRGDISGDSGDYLVGAGAILGFALGVRTVNGSVGPLGGAGGRVDVGGSLAASTVIFNGPFEAANTRVTHTTTVDFNHLAAVRPGALTVASGAVVGGTADWAQGIISCGSGRINGPGRFLGGTVDTLIGAPGCTLDRAGELDRLGVSAPLALADDADLTTQALSLGADITRPDSDPGSVVSQGTLTGGGTIHAPTTMAGTVAPATQIVIDGALTMAPTTRLEIDLPEGGGSDSIAATGAAVIDGTVTVTAGPGRPALRERVDVVSCAGGCSGGFDLVSGTDPALGMRVTGTLVSLGRWSSTTGGDARVGEGAASVEIDVALPEGPTDEPISFGVSATGGTAVAGQDFATPATTVTIAAGATVATVSVPILQDAVNEADEQFTISLSPPAHVRMPDAQTVVTIADDGDPPAVPSPTPSATPAVTATATPTATSTPAFPPAPQAVDFLPSSRRCASRRSFRIKLARPKGVKVISATVTVGSRKIVLKGNKKLTAPIDLRGLRKGQVVVKITLKLAGGKTIKGQRVYKTCEPRKRG